MDQALFDLHAAVEERHWWFRGRRRVMRALIESVLPPTGAGSVLDVGAGTGANLASLSDAYHTVGMDAAESAVAHARARFPEVEFLLGTDVSVLASRATPPCAFLLMDVIEHVKDDFRLVSEVVAAMPVGAHLLLTVPADPRLWSHHDIVFGHFRRYTPSRLAAVWEGLPVEVRLFADLNHRLAPIVRLIRAASRRLGAPARPGGDLARPPRLINRALERILAGERRDLVRHLDRWQRRPPGGRGVSLVAVLRRRPGTATARNRPEGVAPDTEYQH